MGKASQAGQHQPSLPSTCCGRSIFDPLKRVEGPTKLQLQKQDCKHRVKYAVFWRLFSNSSSLQVPPLESGVKKKEKHQLRLPFKTMKGENPKLWLRNAWNTHKCKRWSSAKMDHFAPSVILIGKTTVKHSSRGEPMSSARDRKEKVLPSTCWFYQVCDTSCRNRHSKCSDTLLWRQYGCLSWDQQK